MESDESRPDPVTPRTVLTMAAVFATSFGLFLWLVVVRRYRLEEGPWWTGALVIGVTLVALVSGLSFWLGVTQRLAPIARTLVAYVLSAALFAAGLATDQATLILVGVMAVIAAFVWTLAEWDGIEAQLARYRHARAAGAALLVLGLAGTVYLGMNLMGVLSLHADQREGFMGAVLAFPIVMVLTGVKLLRGRAA